MDKETINLPEGQARSSRLEQLSNPITLGSISSLPNAQLESLFAEIRAKRKKRRDDNRVRLEGKYNRSLTDDDIDVLLKYEDESAICANCRGYPCPKTGTNYTPTFTPVLRWFGDSPNVAAAICKFRLQDTLNRKFKSSCIPSRYLGKTLDDYTVDSDNRTAVKYASIVKDTKIGAYFYGDYGSGKTFLASVIAQELLKDGYSVLFVKVPSLLNDIRMTYNVDSKVSEEDLIENVTRADVLVLDDFGIEKPTRFAGTILCRIIDARYDEGKMTLITSNYTLDQLQYTLDNASDGKNLNGSRIVDRLREFCKPILLGGKSRRK